jgi:hypothetical protein
VQDALRVLSMLPAEPVFDIDLVVLRQPTEKQRLLGSVWGRLGYWSTIGRYHGTGVYLDAQSSESTLEWPRSLDPAGEDELERLRADGFRVEAHSRGYRLHPSPEAIRCTQLYRTLPHEVGHYADYLACKRSLDLDGDEDRSAELYWTKPERDKEAFAHRYAEDFVREMKAKRLLPFPPRFDAEMIRADGLDPAWFARVG